MLQLTKCEDAVSRRSRAARAMLARFMPLSHWLEVERPSPEMAYLGLALMREVVALAKMTPEEELTAKIALGLEGATAAMEACHVRS